MLLGQVARAFIQMLSVVILSRLLAPEDFGLIAIATAVTAFGELLRDSGLTTSALRAPVLTRHQASNLFWANTALAVGFAILLVAGAPLLAMSFDDDRLLHVLPILAATLVFNGVGAQVTVQLSRSQRYLAMSLTDVASQTVALGLAIIAALQGFGYWALVIQLLAAPLFLVTSRWLASRWLPSLPRRHVQSAALIKSGLDFAGSQLLTFLSNNVDTFILGARWGAGPLGYYNRAFQLLTTPLTRLLTPLTNVAIPTLNQVKLAGNSVHDSLLKLQVVLALPTVLLFSVAAGSASSLIPILLGPSWEPAIPLFQILALGGAFRGLGHLSYWAFLVEGNSRNFLKASFVSKGLTIAVVISAGMISVEAVAWAYSVCVALNWLVNLWWLQRTAGMPAARFIGNGFRFIAVGAVACAASWLVAANLVTDVLFVDALIQCLSGLVAFVAACVASSAGRRDLKIFGNLVKDLKSK